MKITIYSKPNCPYCSMAKNLAEMKGAEVRYYARRGLDAKAFMAEFPTARTFPQIVPNGTKIGGYQQLRKRLAKFKFREDEILTRASNHIIQTYDAHYSMNKIQSTELL